MGDDKESFLLKVGRPQGIAPTKVRVATRARPYGEKCRGTPRGYPNRWATTRGRPYIKIIIVEYCGGCKIYIVMKSLFKQFVLLVVGFLVVYLLIPSPSFPSPLPNSPQSREPGDVKDLSHKRAYFTNMSRAEVMDHYSSVFYLPGLSVIPKVRLNYPPEEAFTYIDDQTLSNYLEEFVFPLRESLYVNGYEPGPDDDQIAFEGTPYKAKVTVRYYRSNVFARLLVVGLSLGMLWWGGREYLNVFRRLKNNE